MLVGGVVVHDEVQLETGGRLRLNLLQKLQPLAVGVASVGAGDDLALEVIQGGKGRHGAVTVVVVGARLKVAGFERQARLGALQGLNLAFSSSQHNTRAWSGGSRYSPRMSRELG